jgi:plastocyanin
MQRPRLLRTALVLGLFGLLALVVAACSSSESPGWTYAPASPSASPAASGGQSAAPSTGPSTGPSPSSAGGAAIELVAENIAFDKQTILAPAGQPFRIHLVNNDAGVQHNVEIKDANGQSLFRGDFLTGVADITYDVPALPAGEFVFVCTVHPNMTGTLSAG